MVTEMMRVVNEFNQIKQQYPILTWIVLINLCIFVLTTVPIFPNRFIFSHLAGVNLLIANGEWWRLITPIFVHSHFNHLFFNSLGFIFSGIILGEHLKSKTLLFIYLSSGIFANILTLFFAAPNFIHVGSSGAIFGLLGVLATLLYYKKMPHNQAQALMVIIIFALIFTFLQSHINVYAHIGGFLWGCLCGVVIERKIDI